MISALGRLPRHRSPPDREARKKASIQMFSQNCRGMKSRDRELEFWDGFRRRNAFAACLQETWREDVGVTEERGFGTLVWGSPDAQKGRGSAGVAIALSPVAANAWESGGCKVFQAGNGRVVGVRLLMKDGDDREVPLFLISAYAPVGTDPQEKWDMFFDSLDAVMQKSSVADFLMVGMDANSSMGGSIVGSTVVGSFGNPHINNSGRRMRAFLALRGMVSSSTFFKKRDYSTWLHPCSRLGHQIDHFVCRKGDLCRVSNCGVVAQLMDSDHRALQTTLRVRHTMVRKVDVRQQLLRHELGHLVGQGEKVDEAKGEFCEVVHRIMRENGSEGPVHDRLMAGVAGAMEEQPKKGKPAPSWYVAASEKLAPLIQHRNAVCLQCIRNPRLRRKLCNATTPWTKLRQLRKEVRQEVGRAKSKWVTDQCKGINVIHGKGVWECVGELVKGLQKSKPSAPCRLQKEDGTGRAESPEENAGIFKRSFNGLYGREPSSKEGVHEQVEQQTVHEELAVMPEEKEIVAAVKRLNLSSPGRSGVTAVAMKALLADRVLTTYIVQYVQHF